jgi:hypothetical protein
MCHQGVHNPRNVKCNKCDSYFKSERSLKKHMNIHKKKKDETGKNKLGTFICDLCGKVFGAKASICNHMQNHIQTRIKCEVCKRRYTRKNFKEHQGSEICRRRYKCKINNCGKTFVHRQDALKHQGVHNPRNVKCKECISYFKNERCLKVHMKVHKKQDPFNQIWTINSVPFKIFD